MKSESMEPLLVTRAEAARLLGCSRVTVIRLVAKGLLDEVRFTPESHPRFRLEDVRALAYARDREWVV